MATYIPGPTPQINADWNATSGAAQILNKPTLGTAASLNVGTAANNVVQLDNAGKLPALDASALINLNTAGIVVGTSNLSNGSVTYAKIQNVSATDRLLGRSSAGAGPVEEIACTAAGRTLLASASAAAQRTALELGTLATQSGTFSGTSSGTNTGDQTITLTGDVLGSGTGSFAATLVTTGVVAAAYGSASQVAAITVDAKGRITAASNTSISIASTAISDSSAAGRAILTAASAANQLTTMGAAASGSVTASGLTMSSSRLLGRQTASNGAIEEIVIGDGLTLSGGTLSAGSAAIGIDPVIAAMIF